MIEAMWTPWTGPGLEHLRLTMEGDGVRADGLILGLDEAGQSFRLRYEVRGDLAWQVREVRAERLDSPGTQLHLIADGEGSWREANGEARPDLAGSIDVDLTATPFTNTLPIRRLGLERGESAAIAVAWVDAPSLRVTLGRQRYTRLGPAADPLLGSEAGGSEAVDRYRYESLGSDFVAELPVDGDGLVLDYPGLFRRCWSR